MTRSNRIDHIRLTSHPAPGAKLKFPDHLGRADARASAGRSSARCRARRTATSSARMAAPMRSIARWRSRPARSIRSGGPTSPIPIRPPRSARSRNGPSRSASSRSIPGGISSRKTSRAEIAEGIDIRPSIAVTRARLDLPEMQRRDRSRPAQAATARSCTQNGSVSVVKIAIDPVWYLPGIAERFGTTENESAPQLFEQTAGMFPELVTRPDLQVFLPPIGGITVYLFGDVSKLADHAHHDHLPRARRVQRLRRVRLRHLHLPALSDARHRGMRARRRRAAGSASSSTTARKAARSARSPSSWSTTRASARKAATPRRHISSAPNASPACRTRASSS